MPVFALYNFNDTGTDALDSALGNGAQNGIYLNGATASGGQAVLDGQNDIVKIYPNATFQMDRGTLEIQFTTTDCPIDAPQTVVSRDSVGTTDGGYHVDVLPDGSVQIVHEDTSGTQSFGTPAGFYAPGDEVKVSYSWDEATGGNLVVENLTTGTSFDAPVPAGLTMDMSDAGQSQPWIVGAGQSASNPNALNNINQHFQGQVEYFSLSDTVDNQDGTPDANPDTAVTDEDVGIDIPVLDNDTDPQGQPLTVVGGGSPNGTVSVNPDGTLRYVPNPDFNGEDTITYTITDPDGNTATSTVTVTVNPVNDDPVANPDATSTPVGVPVTIPVLGNDTDVDGDTLTVTGTPVSADGDVVVNGDGTITFTPAPGFAGDATITYDITDGNGGSASSTVTVTVTGQPPVRDGYVDGTAGGDLIDTAYTGDPDGDFIDNDDAILPGDVGNDDNVRAGAGNDTVYAELGDDQVDGAEGDDLVFGGEGSDTIGGSTGDDSLLGEDGGDAIGGGDGDDFIDASGGNSSDGSVYPLPDRGYPGLYPADADPANDLDTVYGGAGADTILTGDDADLVYGGDGDDDIDGGFDDDSLYGDLGADTIVGGEGSDFIDGGADGDLIYGGLSPAFPDWINIPDATDLRPDNGRDTILGGAGDDTIFSLDDNDLIEGGEGADLLDGGIDQDTIFGGAGNDTISGGEGIDSLHGGDDRDVFIIGNREGGTGDFVDGNEGGDDFDTLNLSGSGPMRINYDPDNVENGTVDFLDADGNVTGVLQFRNIENVIPCFTPGTLIATPKGEVPVESLKAGDRVITRDNGIQEIRWTGAKVMGYHDLALNPHLKPILIRQGSLGNGLPERDMMVSPNHRVLVANDRTALYFDEHEVLVSAKHLVAGRGVHEVDSIGTTYIHFMFDRHEVVLSNGAWTESFQPGDYTLKGMGNAQRNEIFELFPDLKTSEGISDYAAARRTLKKHEARLLVK